MKVLSWNLFLLPFGLSKGNSKYRLKHIAQYLLHCDADVICLQELFAPKQFVYLQSILTETYPYSSGAAKRVGMDMVSSGLVIFSKQRLEQVVFQEFIAKASVDALSSKGILAATICLRERKYRIINTHLQFVQNNRYFIGLRKKQLEEIKSFIAEFCINEDTILAGDLNVDFHNPEFKIIQEIFDEAYWSPEENFNFSVDGLENSLMKKNERSRIDHIFLLSLDKGRISPSEVPRPKCDRKIDLSDHYPIVVEVDSLS